MTDEKFTELVNLYFDKEISGVELEELKSEIEASPDRKKAFAERCRLHKAMRMALEPEKSRSRRRHSRSRRRSSSASSTSSSRSGRSRRGTVKASALDASYGGQNLAYFPRWLLASGVAASLVVGLVVLTPVFRDTTSSQSQPALIGVSDSELVDRDALASLDKPGLRRYAVLRQQRELQPHASLISQMRLMGLRPEHTPKNKNLREVSMAAVYDPKQHVDQAELFQRIQGLKAMPEPQLLRLEETTESTASSWWPAPESSDTSFQEL